MFDEKIDLDAYFSRIGYEGPRAPTLETLRAVHRAHAQSVPFENLDVLTRAGIHLDPAALETKIVASRRGGYCFEQNGLFLRVLRQLGFDAHGLIARVRWMAPEEVETPLSHMLIRVDFPEQNYLADVGFGGYRMTEPIRFVADEEQETAHGRFRLIRQGASYMLQAELGDKGWSNIYRFLDVLQSPVDYDQASWYTSTHPQSLFVNNLLVEIPADDGRYFLFNNMLTVRRPDQDPEMRHLPSGEAIAQALRDHFSLEVRSDAERAILDELAARPQPA